MTDRNARNIIANLYVRYRQARAKLQVIAVTHGHSSRQYQAASDRMWEVWNILQLAKGWAGNSPKHASPHRMLNLAKTMGQRNKALMAGK